MSPIPDLSVPALPDKPRYRKYRHDDNVVLRKSIEPLLAVAIQSMLGGKINYKVLSSNIAHTSLLPEGDHFTINFVVEVHEKIDLPLPDPSVSEKEHRNE